MKRFNPEKELNKIKNGNKKKVIIGICTLLLIIGIGSTYALYQVRHSNKLTHITVKQFYQNDLDLAVYIDGIKKVTKEDFPTKENGTNLIYTGIKCEDGKQVKASWDYNDWSLILESKLPNKCSVYFETRWKDSSGASYPELYQGLIPITIGSNGEIHIADLSQKWYDYDAHEWANAVLVNDTAYKRIVNEDGSFNTNEPISLDTDILQMYVWIPRYRYKLWNVLNENSNPFAIEIEFENNTKGRSLGQTNGEWLTHPAFLFGDTELNGIWVGKFEPSDAQDAVGRNRTIDEITILPNKTSIVNKKIKTMLDATQSIAKTGYNLKSQDVDTHIMKNSEWGAVAYLTSSKYGRYESDGNSISSGAEVWINNTAQGAGTDTNITYKYGGTFTGCAGSTATAQVKWNDKDDGSEAKCEPNYVWSKDGVKASTTGNMYGIYDMVGGAQEYVMGVVKKANLSGPDWASSGIEDTDILNSKYYDLYEYSNNNATHGRGHLGDATKETLENFSNVTGGWNNAYAYFPSISDGSDYPWFTRGGLYSHNINAGIFAFSWSRGTLDPATSFRVVLTAQDGNE